MSAPGTPRQLCVWRGSLWLLRFPSPLPHERCHRSRSALSAAGAPLRSVRRRVRRSAGRCCCSDGNTSPAGSCGAERAGQPSSPPHLLLSSPRFSFNIAKLQPQPQRGATGCESIGVRVGKPGGDSRRRPPPPPPPFPSRPSPERFVPPSPGPAAPGRRGHGSPGPDGASAARPPGSVRRDTGSPDPRGRERRTAAPAPDGGRRSAPPTDGREPYTPTAARHEPDRWRCKPPPSPAPRSGPYLRRRLRLSARRLRLQWRRRLPLCRCRGCAAPRRAALFRQWKTPGSDAGGDRSGAGALPGPPGFLPPPGGALTQGRRRRLPAPPAGGAAREGPGGRWGGLGPERGRRRREGLLANRACLRGWETEPRRDPRRASGA